MRVPTPCWGWGWSLTVSCALCKRAGFQCPDHYNPAEFFVDKISIDFSSKEKEAESRERLLGIYLAMRKRMPDLAADMREASHRSIAGV